MTQDHSFGRDRCETAQSAWVNPQDHHDAVIDRGVSPALLVMLQLLGTNWLLLMLGVIVEAPGIQQRLQRQAERTAAVRHRVTGLAD